MEQLPFFFLTASDGYLLKSAITKYSKDLTVDGKPWETHFFWGDEGLSESFWEHLFLQGLFALPKLLVIRNAQILPVELLKELSTALGRIPGTVRVIICLEVIFERGKPKIPAHILKLPCYLFAEKHKSVSVIAELTPAILPRFITNEATRLGLRLTPPQVNKLSTNLLADAAQVSSELEKLSLAANANGTLPDSALSLIEQTGEANIFEMLRTLQTGKNPHKLWLAMYEEHMSGESLIFSLLAILVREARTLWQILAGETPAIPPQAIPSKKALALSLGYAGIAKLWELALEADRSIKSGEKSPEQTFEFLAADLFILFQRSPTGYR